MKAAANPLETDLQTQINILQSESVLRQVIAKLDLGTKLLAEKDEEPPLRLAQSPASARVEAGLGSRRHPAPGGREPEGSPAGQHAAGRNPLRFHRPAPGRRRRQHPDRRVHPARTSNPTGKPPSRPASGSPVRWKTSASSSRNPKSSSRPMPAPRAFCSPRRRIMSPKTSCASFSRNSPGPRPIASPSSRNTSWRLRHPRIRFPKCWMMPPSRITR